MSNAFELINANKSFKTFSLKNVSFSLKEGYIMGFIGQNGAGKTTTIKLMLDMLKLDSGEINIFSKHHTKYSEEIKEDIGVVMDKNYFVGDWSLKDVERAIAPFYKNWNSSKYTKLLKEYNLPKKKKVKELSNGMSMKLMIAVALSHDAKLLILDEPTSGLDPVARDDLLDTLREFVMDERKSVLFSTHITADLEKVADFITFIQDGEIFYTGTKDELLDRYIFIKGGQSSLSGDARKKVIGLREHSVGFDGMIERENLKYFSKDVVTETVSLDEIIIRIEKETRNNEN